MTIKTVFLFLFLIIAGCSFNYLLSALNIVNIVNVVKTAYAASPPAGASLTVGKTSPSAQGRIKISLASAIKSLPEDKQSEVLDFIEYLQSKTITQDRDFALKKEFSEWDVLTDDALNDFEDNLS